MRLFVFLRARMHMNDLAVLIWVFSKFCCCLKVLESTIQMAKIWTDKQIDKSIYRLLDNRTLHRVQTDRSIDLQITDLL